jgi:c-di-GMP-binding flagellar brake protein YcgR
MKEKRKTERLKEFNEITTTIISGEKNFYNYSEDISVSGAKIRGNVYLPIDTLLKIDFTLKNLQQKITALGKVKWIKTIIENKYYEAGVEFVNTSREAIEKLENYISWKQKRVSLNPFRLPFGIPEISE